MRGKMLHAPMSQPPRPTRENKNATRLRAVPTRKSEAIAMMAPAPAHTPSTAAINGCGHERIAFTRSPVIRVKAKSSGAPIFVNGR
jgi:hypothetical protein